MQQQEQLDEAMLRCTGATDNRIDAYMEGTLLSPARRIEYDAHPKWRQASWEQIIPAYLLNDNPAAVLHTMPCDDRNAIPCEHHDAEDIVARTPQQPYPNTNQTQVMGMSKRKRNPPSRTAVVL